MPQQEGPREGIYLPPQEYNDTTPWWVYGLSRLGFYKVWISLSIHCLAALNLGAGVKQPFDCLVVQNLQNVYSMGRSMAWTLEGNMVDGLFFCTTLTGRRGGHTPFVQARAKAAYTGAKTVKPYPGCSGEGHCKAVGSGIGMKLRSFLWLSNHSAFHWWSAQCAPHTLLVWDELVSCCAARTNGCHDLKRRAFASSE